ncbi:GTP cyclohydrolase I [Hyaloscypha variabilis]
MDGSDGRLLNTLERCPEAMLFFFVKGYEENLRAIVNGAMFHEDYDEMHQLILFSGKMHIGYIPSRRVIGLSKIARIERLTKQVVLALSKVLQAQGVAVVKTRAITTTGYMLGRLWSTAKTKEEFLSLIIRK